MSNEAFKKRIKDLRFRMNQPKNKIRMSQPKAKRRNSESGRKIPNKTRVKAWNTRNSQEAARVKKALVLALGGCCCRCGNGDERVLQFHHNGGGGSRERRALVVTANGKPNPRAYGDYYRILLARVLTGNSSLALLCSNCHIIRHDEERREKNMGRYYRPDFVPEGPFGYEF